MSIEKGRRWFIDRWIKDNVKKLPKNTSTTERYKELEMHKNKLREAMPSLWSNEQQYAHELIQKKVGV